MDVFAFFVVQGVSHLADDGLVSCNGWSGPEFPTVGTSLPHDVPQNRFVRFHDLAWLFYGRAPDVDPLLVERLLPGVE